MDSRPRISSWCQAASPLVYRNESTEIVKFKSVLELLEICDRMTQEHHLVFLLPPKDHMFIGAGSSLLAPQVSLGHSSGLRGPLGSPR